MGDGHGAPAGAPASGPLPLAASRECHHAPASPCRAACPPPPSHHSSNKCPLTRAGPLVPCPKARRRREGPGAAPSREGPLSGHGPFFRASPRAQSLPAGPQPPAPPALLPLPIINPNKCPLTRAGPLVPCPKARRHRRSRAGPSSCHGPFPRRSSRPLRAQPTTWGIIKGAPRTSPGCATLTCTSTAPRSALRRMARAATPRTEGGPRRPLGRGARQAPCRALGAAGQQPGPKKGLHRQGHQLHQGADQ